MLQPVQRQYIANDWRRPSFHTASTHSRRCRFRAREPAKTALKGVCDSVHKLRYLGPCGTPEKTML
jgi:hypothetical protein